MFWVHTIDQSGQRNQDKKLTMEAHLYLVLLCENETMWSKRREETNVKEDGLRFKPDFLTILPYNCHDHIYHFYP